MLFIKIRNYPQSNKLTLLNGMLLCLNIFLGFVICFLSLMFLGGPGTDLTGIETVCSLILPFIFFFLANALSNRFTDKKYFIVLKAYDDICSKLINQDPTEAKGIQLTRPATITFNRQGAFHGQLVKINYNINDTEYKLSNGESTTFTTNSALNSIHIKSLSVNSLQHFTVTDGEQLTIDFCAYYLKDVHRN